MDVQSSPLLKTLIEHSPGVEAAETEFVTALARLGIESVFDIVRMSRGEFAAQLQQQAEGAEAGQAYDNAMGYAAQLDALYREQRMSSAPGPLRKARGAADEIGTDAPDKPTYPMLFKENWGTFCSSTSLAANDSPAAYLRALYLFATQLEKGATGNTNTLQQRRPDLRQLMINTRTTFNQVPMLSIIIKTLEEHIRATQQADIYQLLNNQAYPYRFPYNYYHHQCQQGLLDKNVPLGEFNYRISPRLSPFDNRRYSPTQLRPSTEAQRLLSGLSPEQQNLLLTPLAEVSDQVLTQFFETHYNHTVASLEHRHRSETQDLLAPLSKVEVFLQRTQLDANELQGLLAQNAFAPHLSPAVPDGPMTGYGSVYVNGPDRALAPMTLVSDNPADAAGSQRLSNTSVDRFDRLHRMIRLQRWLKIPFVDVDALVVSAMRCESSAQQVAEGEDPERDAHPGLQLTGNTLRALGVYRHFNRTYGLTAEEFAALLHEMPIHGSGQRLSLFDRVFNPPQRLGQALVLDGKGLNSTTRQQLCAALGLNNTHDSLQLLIRTIPKDERQRTRPTISSLYRQARIARLFGLSVLECRHLLEQLGPTHLQQYITPSLRSSASQAVDFLDVLMHLDWTAQWRRDSGVSIATLRRQLMLTPLHGSSSAQPLPDQLPAESPLQLPVSNDTWHSFQQNPHWLDNEHPAGSPLDLTLNTVYLLQRLHHCVDRYGRPEETLLAYFGQINDPSPASAFFSKDANAWLATLLGWAEKEVQTLVDTLAGQAVTAVNQLDWLMRCQHACMATGLSADVLLKAGRLGAGSLPAEWKIVGEALASHPN